MLVLPERERTKKGAIGVETKGVTCKIPLDLHNQISEEIRETESTMSKFIEMIIREHYEKGANRIMEKGRTLAFQVSEELFQRVKEYLENYEKAYHRRLTQKEFVIGLIEQALEEAEEEFEAARAAEHEEQAENGWEAAEIAESDEDEEVSDDEEPEDWDEENGETEGLSADEETTGSSWEPAENTETGEGEEEPSEDDEDTTPESWNQDEEEETEPDDDTILKQQWNRVVVVRKQEILLLSEVSSLYSVACTADLAGILVSVDATTAKESLYSLCRMMGDLKLNTFEVKKYMDKQDGCAVIHGSSWVFSTFSEIVKMEDFQKSRYCVWKSVELLFLLSTGTLYPKDKDNLKISILKAIDIDIVELTEFDDTFIRRIVEQVTILSKDKIEVRFIGGFSKVGDIPTK